MQSGTNLNVDYRRTIAPYSAFFMTVPHTIESAQLGRRGMKPVAGKPHSDRASGGRSLILQPDAITDIRGDTGGITEYRANSQRARGHPRRVSIRNPNLSRILSRYWVGGTTRGDLEHTLYRVVGLPRRCTKNNQTAQKMYSIKMLVLLTNYHLHND